MFHKDTQNYLQRQDISRLNSGNWGDAESSRAYYGRASFAPLMGIMLAVGIALKSLSLVITGIIYDSRSIYIPAFVTVAGFSLVGLKSFSLYRQLDLRNKI